MEEKCISKIRIEDSTYDIKDEELRKGLEKLLGKKVEVPQNELNVNAKDD